MRKFWSVSGQLVEVQRYINVPMRWCEQYPARERRELWVSTTSGQAIKLIVHSSEMPARRGHQLTALLLGERLVGICNVSNGKQLNYLRTDPPLLWRRCDAAAVAALSVASIVAFAFPAWPAGSKLNLPSSRANRWRSNAMPSGGVVSAALVHSPAWMESASTFLPFHCGTIIRSSGTRR